MGLTCAAGRVLWLVATELAEMAQRGSKLNGMHPPQATAESAADPQASSTAQLQPVDPTSRPPSSGPPPTQPAGMYHPPASQQMNPHGQSAPVNHSSATAVQAACPPGSKHDQISQQQSHQHPTSSLPSGQQHGHASQQPSNKAPQPSVPAPGSHLNARNFGNGKQDDSRPGPQQDSQHLSHNGSDPQPEKHKVPVQQAPQRRSSSGDLGSFWKRLPWRRGSSSNLATPPDDSHNPSAPETAHAAGGTPAQSSTAAPSSNAPLISANGPHGAREFSGISSSLLMPVSGSQRGSGPSLCSEGMTLPSDGPMHSADGLSSGPHPRFETAAGPGSEPILEEGSMPADVHASTQGVGAHASTQGGGVQPQADGSLPGSQWPLADDITTGFPHWANILMGYPTSHDDPATERSSADGSGSASGSGDESSWRSTLKGFTSWPLPDDISTGFPQWANILLGYPTPHGDASGTQPSSTDGGSSGDAGLPQGEAFMAADGSQKRSRQLLVLEADRTCWRRMMLSVDMINDHLPDTYLEVVQLL